ncbi:hypothetical protein PIB30_052089 [Stylosanthes scabra]|uniref:Uncharacterized protein n=1 Tax=Stylosanthes scabra TaxID=79078 RepID=A0ABU6QIY4_9FABA|nr:hypothetical protein [Stylosanthes scabra]
MRENWARVGWRIGSNQFSRRSRQLPITIIFDPELRLTHGLGLREALVALFPSIMHANHGTFWSLVIDADKLGYLRNWRIGGGDERLNMRMAMDCAWMLDGATKDRVYALSLASRFRVIHEMGITRIMRPVGRNDERNEMVMI